MKSNTILEIKSEQAQKAIDILKREGIEVKETTAISALSKEEAITRFDVYLESLKRSGDEEAEILEKNKDEIIQYLINKYDEFEIVNYDYCETLLHESIGYFFDKPIKINKSQIRNGSEIYIDKHGCLIDEGDVKYIRDVEDCILERIKNGKL